jgi:predicted PurR-regulated permease PerM
MAISPRKILFIFATMWVSHDYIFRFFWSFILKYLSYSVCSPISSAMIVNRAWAVTRDLYWTQC